MQEYRIGRASRTAQDKTAFWGEDQGQWAVGLERGGVRRKVIYGKLKAALLVVRGRAPAQVLLKLHSPRSDDGRTAIHRSIHIFVTVGGPEETRVKPVIS